jgi:hypothetical protein
MRHASAVAPSSHSRPWCTLPAMAVARRLKIFFHDNCFDGTASAAVFSTFYRDAVAPRADVRVEGMQHSLGDPFAGRSLDGDDNACVDFRYCASPAMNWWFDHHATAFQPPSLRDHYLAHRSDRSVFDPAAPSCAGLMLRELERVHGWKPPEHLRGLARWADVIDTAGFASAAVAISLGTAAQRLAAWVAATRPAERVARYIAELAQHDLDEVASASWLKSDLRLLADERERMVELVKKRATQSGQVVSFDLSRDAGARAASFIGYYLFPSARYTVSLIATARNAKISVGHNPWFIESAGAVQHDIGALCEAYGGGGHSVVGGVTLPVSELERAREIATAIVTTLA